MPVLYLRAVSGKQVCVLGSGDNQNVFAIAGMGAHVTSVDISENQLNIAKERAAELGLEVTFLRADVTDLLELASDTFDMVYTGGHVAVWVSDLKTYYSEAVRILKPSGIFMVNEYHPFRRIWKESKNELIVESDYFNRGPFEYDVTDEEAQSIVAGLAEGFEGELESRISKRRFGAKFGGFSGPMGFEGMTGIKE